MTERGRGPAIEMKGVSVAYRSRPVLDRVDLRIDEGDFWFLLGPNGAGKTTLVKAILGMVPLREGRISLHPDFYDRTQIGFVPQRSDLNSTLPTTVREFVGLGLAGIPAGRKERRERLRWALDNIRLTDLAGKDLWSLSGGQRQRALVARALIRRPRLFIADEPTKDLDLVAVQGLMDLLARLNREEGLTVLFITHDLPIASRYCTHTALFMDGTVRTGSCRHSLNPEDIRRAFGLPGQAEDHHSEAGEGEGR
jgi:ABC-type Mn2+/Zn2+ transport system ATPase subunit